MSAGNCDGPCGGDGVHPSRHDAAQMIICFRCQGTGNWPPTHSPLIAAWVRFTRWADRQIDRALDRFGAP